jgi:hypothetical protein
MRGGGEVGAVRVDDVVAHTFGVETILPTQVGRSPVAAHGLTALYAAILERALDDAGLLRTRAMPPRPASAATRALARQAQHRRALAVAWLLGQLEYQVDVSLELVCMALDLEPAVLGDVVRRRQR